MPFQTPAQANEQPGAQSARKAPIVGIGASAGGLEAFSELLTHLPDNTGLSFVFIQHLDPHHESKLTELLQRRTRMKVQQASDGMSAEPNEVYIIPPNTAMEIQDRTLQLSVRQTGPVQMPVDIFFRSLAEDQGAVSIGVVLSGSASDGTLGLTAIRGEGGITFAQDPASAGFDGMPRSAIAAGCVDFVLTPKGIAQELVRISRHPYVFDPDIARAQADQEREFAEIFGILRTTSGVDFSLYKHATVRRRIFRRMALHKIETLADYARFLRDRRSEADALFQDLLINVTAFFREPATFQALYDRVFPALILNRAADDPVRVWIPGCSTGEEAYSIAMVMTEFLSQSGTITPVQIFGTDLSDAALERARAGIYPESISVDVSPDRLRKFFTKVNGHYQITRTVRDLCIFARQNLTKDPPFSHLDLLMCRNLLIYLGPALQKKVMRVFHYALKPSGFLVLGMSESVGSSGDLFAPIDRTLKIYTRKSASIAVTVDFESYEDGPNRAPIVHSPPIDTPVDVQKRVEQALLSRYIPAALVVNRDLRILHFRGQTGRYLEHATGAANLNLQQMARGALGVEVRNLIQEIETKKSPIESKVVSVPLEKELESVELSVSPFDGVPGDPQYLVVFEAAKSPKPAVRGAGPKKGRGKQEPPADRVRELEDELAITRRYLQTVVEDQEAITEELKSANEEIQSSNEELQSTNEELLTAKEELQSTNEELTTVNEEMQNRNDELVRTNNDLLNLLSSVNIPIVMLGNDLKIRRFTPQTERLLNLVPTDVGRPISDFKLKINVPDLEDLVRGVLDHLRPTQREVQDPEGRTYSMWIRPYRTSDNKIDGAVLALFDVTDRKQATEARYRRLFESSADAIIIADQATGAILDVNPFATRFLGNARNDLIGAPIYGLEVFANAGIRQQTVLELEENESLRRDASFTRRDGQWVEAEILANVYHEGDRQLAQFNLRDMTARRSAISSGEVERDARDLETAARMAASISRNFGNDLTTILNLCDLLLSHGSTAPFASDVQRIREAANRAVLLDRQLLAFGRRDTGRKERVNLNEILSGMGQLISTVMGGRYFVSNRVDPALRPIEATPAQIERIILNLLMNARRHTSGGRISVETANVTIDKEFSAVHPAVAPGEYVSISITDTASRAAAETEGNPGVFRVDRSQYSGLPAAFDAVRELDAQVWAFSELGVGSTVRVFFRPAAILEPPGSPAVPEPPAAEDMRGSETILMIDADDEVRAAAARGLKANGYRVLEARSPEAARDIAQRNRNESIHLILADVNQSGRHTAEAARALAEAVGSPLAWVSSETDAVLALQGVLDNPEKLLRKPYSAEQMAIFVRATLRKERAAK